MGVKLPFGKVEKVVVIAYLFTVWTASWLLELRTVFFRGKRKKRKQSFIGCKVLW